MKDIQKKLDTKLQSTLFIFDNVDSLKLIQDYLPHATSKHHVIITTRIASNWPADYFILTLEPFSMKEAYDYITSQIDDVNEDDVKKVASLFNNVPLTLSQAVTHT